METVYKKITVGPFIRRAVNRHSPVDEKSEVPSYSAFTIGNSAEYGCDVIIKDAFLKSILPVDSEGRLRYKTFCEYYYLSIDFGENAKIYKRKEVGCRWKLSDDNITEETDCPILSTFEEINDIEDTGITEAILFENLNLLQQKVPETPSIIKNIIYIGIFCRECFDKPKENNFVYPYIDIPLYISADIHSQGKMEYDVPQWAGGKEYLSGATVIYDGDYYIAEQDKIGIEIKDNGYFVTPSDKDSGWKKINFAEQSEKGAVVKGIAERRSSIFLSKKRYMDNNFVTYPFFKMGGKLYFPYLKRTIKDGEGFARLDKILFNNDVEISQGPTAYAFDDVFKFFETDRKQDIERITFKYSIITNCDEEPTDDIWGQYSVKYNETYNVITSATTEGERYFYIDSGATTNAFNMNDDLKNDGLNPVFAEIEFYPDEKKYPKEFLEHLNRFIKISPIGTEDIKTDIDSNIDRGSAALFERMNILGEVKSLNDLENYRNNYFDI